MIEWWCLFLLRRTARRWPNEGEMLTEWRAELYTMDSRREQLWYALSLAASRPHRTKALPLGRPVPAIVTSFLLLLSLPVAYANIAINWWGGFSEDTVGWQSGIALAGAVSAVVLAAAFARTTSGVTKVIKPLFLPAWVFGIQFLFYMSANSLSPGGGLRSTLIDQSAWLAGATAVGIVVVRLTMRGHKALAWVVVAAATPVVFLLSMLHGLQSVIYTPDEIFGGSSIAATAFLLATRPYLHITLFGLAYVLGLTARRSA